jgi:hypothetical protein
MRWMIACAESALGRCLAAQERYDEAEPRLIKSFRVVSKTPGIPRHHSDRALRRVVDFYEACDRLDKVAEWRTKLPTTQPTDEAASAEGPRSSYRK